MSSRNIKYFFVHFLIVSLVIFVLYGYLDNLTKIEALLVFFSFPVAVGFSGYFIYSGDSVVKLLWVMFVGLIVLVVLFIFDALSGVGGVTFSFGFLSGVAFGWAMPSFLVFASSDRADN